MYDSKGRKEGTRMVLGEGGKKKKDAGKMIETRGDRRSEGENGGEKES